MSIRAPIGLTVLCAALFSGCTSPPTSAVRQDEPSPPGGEQTVGREMLLLYRGNRSPGAGWEDRSEAFDKRMGYITTRGPGLNTTGTWERHMTVTLRVSPDGRYRRYTLSPSELGALPDGETWIGPVHPGSGIGKGMTIGNMPTSSGPMIMLLLTRTADIQWREP